jgi:hypothetical protein
LHVKVLAIRFVESDQQVKGSLAIEYFADRLARHGGFHELVHIKATPAKLVQLLQRY